MESTQSSEDESAAPLTRRMCQRAQSKLERVIAGLLGQTTPPKVSIEEVPIKGRRVVVQEEVPKDSYVIEYEAEVYPRRERAAREREYVWNGEGCFIVDVQTSDGWMCLDGTRRLNSLGRLLNHAPRALATLAPFGPLFLNGKWRVGFIATRNLCVGEELTWDYGCAPNGIDWLRRRPKQPTCAAAAHPIPFLDEAEEVMVNPTEEGVEDEQAPEETMGVEGNGARGGSEDPLDDVKSSGSEFQGRRSKSSHRSATRHPSLQCSFSDEAMANPREKGVEDEQQVEEMMVVEENGAGEPGTEDDVQAVDSFPHVGESVKSGSNRAKFRRCRRMPSHGSGVAPQVGLRPLRKRLFDKEGSVSSLLRRKKFRRRRSKPDRSTPQHPTPRCFFLDEAEEVTASPREEGVEEYEMLEENSDKEGSSPSPLLRTSPMISDSVEDKCYFFDLTKDEAGSSVVEEEKSKGMGLGLVNDYDSVSLSSEDEVGLDKDKDLLMRRKEEDPGKESGMSESDASFLPLKSLKRRKRAILYSDSSDEETGASPKRSSSPGGKGDYPSRRRLGKNPVKLPPSDPSSIVLHSTSTPSTTVKDPPSSNSSARSKGPKHRFVSDEETGANPKWSSSPPGGKGDSPSRRRLGKNPGGPKHRFLRMCPVAGCRSRPQRKLIPQSRPPPSRSVGQPTIRQLFGQASTERNEVEDGQVCTEHPAPRPSPSPSSADELPEVEEGGTRNYPRFDMQHPSFIHFQRYLTGLDGGGRSEKTAREMAVDVSKFLKYACGSSPNPGWERLTDRDQLTGFMEKLKRSSVGPEGQLSKIDGFCSALRFLKVDILRDSGSPLTEKATRMLEVLKGWKNTLRKEKRKLQHRRLEELSCQDHSLDEVNALIDNQGMWREFELTCSRARRGETMSTALLNQSTVMLAASILFKNWQRPGALENVTIQEFRMAKLVPKKEKDVYGPTYIVSVRDHKTALQGYAKLVLSVTDHARILHYINTVRKLQDVDGLSPLLFLLCGSQRLNNLSQRVKRLGPLFGAVFPNASRVRKIGATEAAMNLGDSTEAQLVTRHLGHSAATESRYYQAIVGDSRDEPALLVESEVSPSLRCLRRFSIDWNALTA